MNQLKMLKTVNYYLFLVAIISFLFFVFPLAESFLIASKTLVLFGFTILVLLSYVFVSYLRGSFYIYKNPISNYIILFGVFVLLSTFFRQSYPLESLMSWTGFYLSFAVITVIGSSILPKEKILNFINFYGYITALLVVFSVLQFAGFGPAQVLNYFFQLGLDTGIGFNLVGSVFLSFQLCLFGIIGMLSYSYINKKVPSEFAVNFPVLLIGLIIYGVALLPNKPTSLQMPPYSASWTVALDSIKTPRQALIGVGVSEYTNAYLLHKPASVNATPNWSVAFAQASNLPLTLLTTTGFVGLAIWILFVFKFLESYKKIQNEQQPLFYMILSTILMQLFTPPTLLLIFIQAVLLAIYIKALYSLEKSNKHESVVAHKDSVHNLHTEYQTHTINGQALNQNKVYIVSYQSQKLFFYFVALLLLSLIVVIIYFVYRAFYSNFLLAQASVAINENNLVQAYNLQNEAIATNPYSDTARRKFSATSALVATALANKSDATETEKKQVGDLLQQAVREARSASVINESNSANWINLGQVYAALIPLSEEAANWSIQSYTNAIRLNPNNPMLYLELAKILASQKNYDEAVQLMYRSIQIKSDIPATYYHLGLVLEEAKAPVEAKRAYETTLSLLQSGTEDYTLITQKIEALDKVVKELEANSEQQKAKAGTNTVGSTNGGANSGANSGTGNNANASDSATLTDPNAQDSTSLLGENLKAQEIETTPDTVKLEE